MTREELQQMAHEGMAALQWLVFSLLLVLAALVLWRFW